MKRIKTPHRGTFESLESLLAYDRKWKHEQATEAAIALGGYQSALLTFSETEIETNSGWTPVKLYFFDHVDVLTKLDATPASCSTIEVTQTGRFWKVDIGHPSRHAWWHFDSLEQAITFAIEKAEEIDAAEDPEAAMIAIVQGE